jgi:HD-GYP domain-containing protein (c-di-GMP phosphodiesterase class II)
LIFVPVKQLQAGMTLKRDIYTFNMTTHRIERIMSGEKLTQDHIDNFTKMASITNMNIAGAYIDDGNGGTITEVKSLLPDDLKWSTISGIKQAFEMFDKTALNLNIAAINQIEDISHQLVDIVKSNKKIMVNMFDLKMYDDYTYNHSLGVAVISVAIGAAMNLGEEELRELGLCALLHDIGKTQVPIEIISKPGRLTEEEFDII